MVSEYRERILQGRRLWAVTVTYPDRPWPEDTYLIAARNHMTACELVSEAHPLACVTMWEDVTDTRGNTWAARNWRGVTYMKNGELINE